MGNFPHEQPVHMELYMLCSRTRCEALAAGCFATTVIDVDATSLYT
jgi:hypothetical protein